MTHTNPVLDASVSVSSYVPCLVDSEGLALLEPSIPSGSYTLSTSSAGFLPWKKLLETSHLGLSVPRFLTLRLSGCAALVLFPSAAGGSLSDDD